MKLLRTTKSKKTKDKNGENLLHLKITQVVLAHCNSVNNDYQKDSRVLPIFIPNKLLRQLLDISPKSFLIQNFHSKIF